MPSDVQLSFVLLSRPVHADPVAIIEAAGSLGLRLAHEMGDPDALSFNVEGGGHLIMKLMEAPHPDAAAMSVGPMSPEPDVVAGHTGHYVATLMNFHDGPIPPEAAMGIATAALMQATPAVAAKFGDGAIFYRSDVFASLVEAAGTELPTNLMVDITAADEGNGRMSFLTHGLGRFDREEFYVTSSVNGQGALGYLLSMIEWMIADPDKVLPTGDTIGRTAEEQIVVQRVPSPIDGKPQVIRLDLDVEANTPKAKKRWFRRS